MLKIRLRRMGSRHRPFYRVVVSDSRQTPTGAAVEEIGHYHPLANPKAIEINVERVDFWVARGAQMSATVRQLVDKARNATPVVADELVAAAAEEETAEEAAAPAAESEASSEEVAAAEAADKGDGGDAATA